MKRKITRKKVALFLLILSLTFVCMSAGCLQGKTHEEKNKVPSPAPALKGGPHDNIEETVNRIKINQAIKLSAHYLMKALDDTGRFDYLINLNPGVILQARYNILRHAGTIYALAMYARKYPDEDILTILDRSVGYLKQTIAPIPEGNGLLAVWSYPEITGVFDAPAQAKLGGTGLGLVALLSVEKIKPGTVSTDYLRKLGNFVCFMQKADGSFYSKYIPSEGGKYDEWDSLYYPGEAALGLIMLYEKDPSTKWLQAAADAMAYLARIRLNKPLVEADHWALLATAKLLPFLDHCENSFSQTAFLDHAVQICQSILAEKHEYPPDAVEYGCLTDDGRTCPTATRLEGLLAALSFFPKENKALRERIISAVTEGILFLLRAQIESGEYAGGIPRTICPLPFDHPRLEKSFDERAFEIRIDYVQHALCAMIQYEQTLLY